MKAAQVDLGIRGERVSPGAHIAYFWENQADFSRGVDFLALGLRGRDHGVIFGHEEANEKVLTALRRKGLDPAELVAEKRLTVVGGGPHGDEMLSRIGEVFQAAVDGGSTLIRLLGNIGWGKPGWPSEEDILAFEAKVTGAARAFPCVVVCMYDIASLPGKVIVHGAFETHPLTFCGNLMRENPYYVEVKDFLAAQRERIGAGAS
jgi:hypothetical protein